MSLLKEDAMSELNNDFTMLSQAEIDRLIEKMNEEKQSDKDQNE